MLFSTDLVGKILPVGILLLNYYSSTNNNNSYSSNSTRKVEEWYILCSVDASCATKEIAVLLLVYNIILSTTYNVTIILIVS